MQCRDEHASDAAVPHAGISDKLNNPRRSSACLGRAHPGRRASPRAWAVTTRAALVVGDQRILERQLAALNGRATRIVVVGGPERHIGGGVEVIPDRLPDIGALGGLYTALVSARSERTLVMACDMPFVTGPFLDTWR